MDIKLEDISKLNLNELISKLNVGSKKYEAKEVERMSSLCRWFYEAIIASNMSTCLSRNVGAAIVKDNICISTGFNGVPRKYPHPKVCIRKEEGLETGCGLNKCVCSHAEINAIVNASTINVSVSGSDIFVTSKPCSQCMGAIVNARIKRVYYIEDYNSDSTIDIAKHAGTELVRITEKQIVNILKHNPRFL